MHTTVNVCVVRRLVRMNTQRKIHKLFNYLNKPNEI